LIFYGLSLLLCWNKFELKQHTLRLFSAQLISISCFLLFPLKFSFERPPLDGFFGLWFDVLMGFDKPLTKHLLSISFYWSSFGTSSADTAQVSGNTLSTFGHF
jgi:hypothetical protein